MAKTPSGDSPDTDMQAIGHQIGSLASVLVVTAVQFGIPLTPGQQSSILSVIAVAWAFFATIYGIRHRIPRRTQNDPVNPRSSTTTRNRAPRNRANGTGPTGNSTINDRPSINDSTTDQPNRGQVP